MRDGRPATSPRAGLSPSSISRLCKEWEAEHERFGIRSLRFHRYAYWFVDGVHVSVRLGEDDRPCLLVVIEVRELVVGDGALGTWAALRDVFPAARRQACWVHKIARVLDALPKRLQPDAKKLLHKMMEAPSRSDARAVLERLPGRSPSSTRIDRT